MKSNVDKARAMLGLQRMLDTAPYEVVGCTGDEPVTSLHPCLTPGLSLVCCSGVSLPNGGVSVPPDGARLRRDCYPPRVNQMRGDAPPGPPCPSFDSCTTHQQIQGVVGVGW